MLNPHFIYLQAEKLSKVIKASGNEVEGYWPGLFAKALQGQDIEKLLTAVAASGPAPAAAAATTAAAADDGAAKEGKFSLYTYSEC